ncbi:MAG: hypothetical protein RR057_03875 [Clostridia bacterium]
MDSNLKLFKSPLISIGLLFLINPVISLFDIFPDFIGYLLIFYGLTELSWINERIELASQKLLYLSGISFLRLLAFFATISYSSSSTITMLSFSFLVAELVLVFSFLKDFFDGFDYLLQRLNGFEALKNQTNTAFITSAFFYTKPILAFIPDLASIFELRAYWDIDNSDILMDIAGYRPYAIILFSLITLIFGIYWYRDILKYFKIIKADSDFINDAGTRYYDTFLSDTKMVIKRCKKIALIFLVSGIVFYIDFTVDMFPVLPTFIGTLLIYFALRWISRITSKNMQVKYVAFACIAQLLTEFFVYSFVTYDVFSMSEVPIWKTLVTIALAALYIFASLLFIRKTEVFLSDAAVELSIEPMQTQFKYLNISYYIFLASYTLSIVFPIIQEHLFIFKLLSMITFVTIFIKYFLKTFGECEEQ